MPNWWPFSKEKTDDEETIFAQFEAQLRQRFSDDIENGRSRQQILYQIEQESQKLERQEKTGVISARLRAYDLLYSEIRPRMLANLTNGKNHEMAGEVADAVRCYHLAIDDQVPTRFPYEHLRVIYRRQQQYEAARQVCQAAINNPYLSQKDHAHFESWLQKLTSTTD